MYAYKKGALFMECTMYIVPIQVCSTILMNKFNFVSRHQIVVVKKQNSRREKRELLKGKKSRKSQKKAWLSMIKTSYFCVSCLSGDTHRCRTIYNFHVKAPK